MRAKASHTEAMISDARFRESCRKRIPRAAARSNPAHPTHGACQCIAGYSAAGGDPSLWAFRRCSRRAGTLGARQVRRAADATRAQTISVLQRNSLFGLCRSAKTLSKTQSYVNKTNACGRGRCLVRSCSFTPARCCAKGSSRNARFELLTLRLPLAPVARGHYI